MADYRTEYKTETDFTEEFLRNLVHEKEQEARFLRIALRVMERENARGR